MTDDELRTRIQKLMARGCDPCAYELLTVNALIEVLGDLSPHEIRRLWDIAIADRRSGHKRPAKKTAQDERRERQTRRPR